MSLDQNLFTLLLTPNTSDSSGLVTDLTDPSGSVHYRKRRILGQVYKIEVYDPISESLLASATSPSATSKHKTIELYNPSKVIELKYTGTLSFRWSFKWEEHEFEWKREECFMIRKPDPPVMVAITKEPPGRIKTSSVQILDYNLNRFDIDDRKGLEIVILTALLTFQDASDQYHQSPNDNNATSSPAALATTTSALRCFTEKTVRKVSGGPTPSPPVPPPKPAPKTGVERVAEIQASTGRGEVNEVFVVDECSVKYYARYCARMLQDEAMLFISIRSAGASQVPKVLQVVEETKRFRHKAGHEQLHQYVLYDTAQIPRRGPTTINLDDNKDKAKGKNYTPPSNIVVHLGKIDMPELQPRRTVPIRPGEGRTGTAKERTKDGKNKDSHKDKEKKVKESSDKERNERKKRETEHAAAKAKLRSKSSAPALASHFSSHQASTSQRPHIHRHQMHVHKSSPPQPNRPANYSAPPLPPRMPVPHRVAPPPNRYSTYGTYPVSYQVRHSSSPQRLETSISPPPPPPSSAALLARLLGR